MNLIEFKYESLTYRISLISKEILTLDRILEIYQGDILLLDNQYYKLQVYSLNQQERDEFTTFTDVINISDDVWTRTQEVFPGITIVGKEHTIEPYNYTKIYNIIGYYNLQRVYVPINLKPHDFRISTQVQFLDTKTKHLYNLLYNLPSHGNGITGYIFVNKTTEELDNLIIKLSKTLYNLELIKVI